MIHSVNRINTHPCTIWTDQKHPKNSDQQDRAKTREGENERKRTPKSEFKNTTSDLTQPKQGGKGHLSHLDQIRITQMNDLFD